MTSAATIDALTALQAIRVLALVVDHHAPLPDPARFRELDTALAHAADDPDLRPYLADPASHHPATVTSRGPLSPTCPPPAPNSPR